MSGPGRETERLRRSTRLTAAGGAGSSGGSSSPRNWPSYWAQNVYLMSSTGDLREDSRREGVTDVAVDPGVNRYNLQCNLHDMK